MEHAGGHHTQGRHQPPPPHPLSPTCRRTWRHSCLRCSCSSSACTRLDPATSSVRAPVTHGPYGGTCVSSDSRHHGGMGRHGMPRHGTARRHIHNEMDTKAPGRSNPAPSFWELELSPPTPSSTSTCHDDVCCCYCYCSCKPPPPFPFSRVLPAREASFTSGRSSGSSSCQDV
jgi:hypothetical protein